MKSRYGNILVLICAILSFAPIVGVDWMLDVFVRQQETHRLQIAADALAGELSDTLQEGSEALSRVKSDSPSACTPTFFGVVHREIGRALSIRDLAVQSVDGVQYCVSSGRELQFSPLSEVMSLPGRNETIQVVQYADLPVPVLRISVPFAGQRIVSVFVNLISRHPDSILDTLPQGSMGRLTLTSGQTMLATGGTRAYDGRTDTTAWISASALSAGLPLRVELAAPLSAARSGYAELDVTLTVLSGLMSGVLLLVALGYVRSSKVPSFDLERAIARGEIKPFYQPIINLRTGALMGCEVLCRWEKKNGKMVPPGQFIDYAESTGLAIPMTLSLMEQVKADLGPLCASRPDLKISINLFDGHFQDGAIVEDVQAIFGGSQIRYSQLVFEITERRPLENSMQTHAVISGLHALGARLALDDTGTGHSSLAYLATLGVDVIKIDRIFVDMIKPGVPHVPVLDGLINMAIELGTEIVAEGVETEEQALYLRARGVFQAQGFLFAPALRAAPFKELALALDVVAPQRNGDVADLVKAA